MAEVTPEQLEALATGIGELTSEVQSLNEAYQGKKAEIDASTQDNEQRTTAAIEGIRDDMPLPHNSIENSYFTEYEEVDGNKIPVGGLGVISGSRSSMELVSPYTFGFACLPSHQWTKNWKDANLDKITDDPALANGVDKFLTGSAAINPGVFAVHPAAVLIGASHPLTSGNVDRWGHLYGSSKYMHVAKITSPAYSEGLAESNWVGFEDSPAWMKAKRFIFRCYVYVKSGTVRFGYQKGYNLDTSDGLLSLDASEFGSNGWKFVELVVDGGSSYKRTHTIFRALTIGAEHDSDAEFYIAMPYAAPLFEGESFSGIGIAPNNDYR